MAVPDLVRRVSASVTLLAALFSGSAIAGDSAQFDAIGYSPDGRYFAFEQFGIQDGSGFAYSEIFIIDLQTDSFVAGAPFRERILPPRAQDLRAALGLPDGAPDAWLTARIAGGALRSRAGKG